MSRDLAAIKSRHRIGTTHCLWDAESWPCDVAQLLALLADTPSVEPPITSDDIDKFTDEQFTAFMHASGFDARIDAALAEAHGKLPLYKRATRPSVEPAGLAEALERATQRADAAEADLTFLVDVLKEALPHLTGDIPVTPRIRELMARAALPTQASDSPEKP